MRIVLFLLFLLAAPVAAQDRYSNDGEDQLAPLQQPVTQISPSVPRRSTVRQTDKHQIRELLSQDAGIEPLARINGWMPSRIESWIRNRIDRYYDPQANVASPFKVVGDQERTAGWLRQ